MIQQAAARVTVGGQNSFSNLFLGLEQHVLALVLLGKKWRKMTPDLLDRSANGAYIHLVFSY